MTPLIKKEIRLLSPSLTIACLLTLANLPFQIEPGNWGNSLWYLVARVFCPAVTIMLALGTFGEEISNGTFSMLLAQPVSRLKIWQTKIGLLAGALSVVTFFYACFFILRTGFLSNETHAFNYWLDFFAIIITFGLVVFSGALWTVLLLRQVAAAFWFTLLLPGLILMVLAALFGGGDSNFFEGITVTVLGLYSLAGFFFARWLFLRTQDIQWSGGTIVLPELRGRYWPKRILEARRTWRPRAALWHKEILLHQSQFVMAFALAALHLVVLAVRKLFDFGNSPDLKFVLDTFWVLWLVMPLLVGCASVAEERKLGTLAGQLCLSVKRRTQFAIKYSVVLELSVLFGVAAPLLLEGTRICPGLHFQLAASAPSGPLWLASPAQLFILNCAATMAGFLPLLLLAGLAMGIGAVSFYVSSFARNTLQTLAPTVLGLLLFIPLADAGNPDAWHYFFHILPPWQGYLIYVIGLPALIIASVFLTFQNFKLTIVGWRTYFRNGLAWIFVLMAAMVATALIYNRAWERLTPFEPPHGRARLKLSNPATLRNDWNTASVRLPDGRIWIQYSFLSGSPSSFLFNRFFGGPQNQLVSPGGHFYDGSNWLNVIRAVSDERIGLKTDGTLWFATNAPSRVRRPQPGMAIVPIPSGNWAQLGTDTNWRGLLGNYRNIIYLVKTDGTLWSWEPRTWDNRRHQWSSLNAFTPDRLGTDSNWAGLFMGSQPYFVRTDGSIWAQGGKRDQRNRADLGKGFFLERAANPQNGQWRGIAMVSTSMNFDLGVRSDGTLRIWADQQLERIVGKTNSYDLVWSESDLQIGQETNWLALAACHNKVVTLKDDGTLWLWNYFYRGRGGLALNDAESQLIATTPVRLGVHSDWISITSAPDGVFTLAADGSLWYWPLEISNYDRPFDSMGYYAGDNSNPWSLVKMSSKPQLLANVFDLQN